MVRIFSGDDTDFKNDQRLALTFEAPDVDFTGCTAEIEFLGQRRTFPNVTNGGRLSFSFSASETRGMRCGVWPVTIRLRDAAGRVRTVDNTQRIKVTGDVNEAYADTEQELSVALRSGGAALPEIPAELDATAADSVGDFKRKYNSLLELLRGAAMLAVMCGAFAAFGASVATAPLNDIPGTAAVVTSVDLSGLTTSLAPATNYTDEVVANRPTRAEVEAGWWSEWTQTPSGPYHWQVLYNQSLGKWGWFDPAFGSATNYWLMPTDENVASLTFGPVEDVVYTVTRRRIAGPIPSALSQLTNDEGYIESETDPVWSSEKGSYATKASVTSVSNIAVRAEGKADTVVAYLQGDDVKEIVTNYDSVVHLPSRSLQQRVTDGGSNYWRVVWNEMTRWDAFTGSGFNWSSWCGFECFRTNVIAQLDQKADRAWGFYDSHTGGWSPDGYTQISSPKILIAAGMAYQRHVVTGGSVWVLESNGLETEIGGVSSNGFFRISDDDGNPLFEIVKGNKRTVGSTAAGIATTNIMGVTHCYVPYNVASGEHPTIYATTALGTPFVSEESSGSLVNVTWTGSSGAWCAEVWPKSASSSLFIKAEHEVGGETYIKNTAPTGLDGGIMYNGTKYRVVPYTTGGKTYLTLEQAQ